MNTCTPYEKECIKKQSCPIGNMRLRYNSNYSVPMSWDSCSPILVKDYDNAKSIKYHSSHRAERL